MFDKKKKVEEKKEEASKPQADLTGQEIHAIPEKFYLPKIKAGGGKTKWIGILIMAAAIVAAAVFAYYLYRTSFPARPRQSAQPTAPKADIGADKKPDIVKEVPKDAVDASLNKKTEVEETVKEAIAEERLTEIVDAEPVDDLGEDKARADIDALPPIRPKILPLGLDKDYDQLTDAEEALYGTDPNKPDSDQDSYLDAHEIKNGYSPLAAGKSLAESNLFLTYNSTDQAYSLLFPATWATEIGEEGLAMFKSASGEFISVGVYENAAGLSPLDWYLNLSPGAAASQAEKITIGSLEAVKSLDKLTVYVSGKNLIYAISYNVGADKKLDYKTTFEVMYNSFRVSE